MKESKKELNIIKPIGVFDSGVGGLSVWKELTALLPFEDVIYFGDTKYCPYGIKSTDFIRDRVVQAISFFKKHSCKLILIACNTATIAGIDFYRHLFPHETIVGIVPVIKTAAEVTKTKRVLILATKSTIENPYLSVLISNFGNGVIFYTLGDEGKIVTLIERRASNEELTQLLQKMFKPFTTFPIDTIVLGSTHFPFIRQAIQSIFGNNVSLLDSGGAVARQVERILTEMKQLAQKRKPNYTFYTSGKADNFKLFLTQLIGIKKAEVNSVTL